MNTSLITKRVPHPVYSTALSKSIYAALAAMTTTGPIAGSMATIFSSVLATFSYFSDFSEIPV
jgi:formate hydrogenlyase subunit 4